MGQPGWERRRWEAPPGGTRSHPCCMPGRTEPERRAPTNESYRPPVDRGVALGDWRRRRTLVKHRCAAHCGVISPEMRTARVVVALVCAVMAGCGGKDGSGADAAAK